MMLRDEGSRDASICVEIVHARIVSHNWPTAGPEQNVNDQQPTVCSIAASPTSSPLPAFDDR